MSADAVATLYALDDQRRFNFTIIDNEVWDVYGDELEALGIHLYNTLCRLRRIASAISHADIARTARVSVDTVQRYLPRLVKLGLVELREQVVTRTHPGGRTTRERRPARIVLRAIRKCPEAADALAESLTRMRGVTAESGKGVTAESGKGYRRERQGLPQRAVTPEGASLFINNRDIESKNKTLSAGADAEAGDAWVGEIPQAAPAPETAPPSGKRAPRPKRATAPSHPQFHEMKAALVELLALDVEVYGHSRLGREVNSLHTVPPDDLPEFKEWFERLRFTNGFECAWTSIEQLRSKWGLFCRWRADGRPLAQSSPMLAAEADFLATCEERGVSIDDIIAGVKA